VGVATYLVSLLQENHAESLAALFTATGFWDAIAADPFDRAEWMEAIRLAPSIKSNFYTILSSRDCAPEAERLMASDPFLRRCFEGSSAPTCGE
jgi:glycerol-1-phosphate dehydrogenase [NAD(P)+]